MLTMTVAPACEPVTLYLVKKHCRVEFDDDDQLLMLYLRAARRYAEETLTGRSLITRKYVLDIDARQTVELTMPPVQTVDAVKLTPLGGAETILVLGTDYTVNFRKVLPVVTLTQIPPTGSDLIIEYTAGYGDEPENVPEDFVPALLLLVDHWYENREPTSSNITQEMNFTISALLGSYRVNWEM